MKLNYPKKTTTIVFFFLTQLIFNVDLIAQVIEESENEQIVELDLNQLKLDLHSAPEEFSAEAATQKTLITLPLPFGVQKTFSAQESSVMDKKLALKYPEIKSYTLTGLDDKRISGRMNVTPSGASYLIFYDGKMAFLENESVNGFIQHNVFYGSTSSKNLSCGTISDGRFKVEDKAEARFNTLSNGGMMRSYRIAIASTGEFTAANGNTDANVTAAITTHLNNLNALYEKELAMRFILIGANDDLIFSNAATDGLDPDGNNGFNRTSTAHNVISGIIPQADYDIGHVFHTIDINSPPCNGSPTCYSSSGLAGLGVVCNNSRKAEGWTGATSTAPPDFFLGTFAHEVGHQFNAEHTFYGTANNCYSNNRAVGNGYEPGSGNSLMSYEGSCTSHNIEPEVSSKYFHTRSLTQILDYANSSGSCSSMTSTGNTPPQVTVPTNVTIPKGTPFSLIGSATDADGDALKYIWEQYDTDNLVLNFPNGAPNDAATSTTAPLFRSFDPSETGYERHFPQLSDILNNTQTQGEILPQVARDMNFRLTARDENSSGGGIDCGLVTITVENTGPFAVTSQNSSTSWTANGSNTATITWSVNGTNTNCPNIDILFSTDEGTTFPITLASGIANDGSHVITIPNISTTTGRIKIKCSDNIFFDINNANVEISSNCSTALFPYTGSGDVTADAGDAALDLTLSPTYGNTISPFTGSITTADPKSNLAYENGNPSSCAGPSNINYYDTHSFVASITGSHTFTLAPYSGLVVNIYSGTFDPLAVCTGFMGSTATRPSGMGNIGLDYQVTVDLVANTTYSIAVTSFSTSYPALPQSYTITNSGGTLYDGTPNPGATYTYTYMAVNSSGVISAISSSSDFRSLSAETYTVYGVSLLAADEASFNSYVGTNIAAIYSGAVCVTLSPNTITLTVNAVVTCPTASVISGNTTICKGESTNISVAITGGVSPYTVVYTDGPSNTTINNYTSGSNISISPSFSKTYSLVSVTDANNCAGTGNTGSAAVTINEGSTVATMSGTATITSGNSTPISVAITGGSSPYTLVYNDGSSDITVTGYNSGTPIQVSPTSNTTYTITSVTDNNNCQGTGNTGNAVITVNTPSSCPNTLNVTAVADGQTYSAANTLTSSIVIPSNNTVTFNAGQSITLGVGFHAAPTSTHMFTAAIASCTPFQAPAVARNNNRSGNLADKTDLSIYPNPATEVVTIDYQLGEFATASIGLYDFAGKKLTDILPMQSQAKGKYQQQFNLGNLNPGMYFVLLQTETEQISKKLILVR